MKLLHFRFCFSKLEKIATALLRTTGGNIDTQESHMLIMKEVREFLDIKILDVAESHEDLILLAHLEEKKLYVGLDRIAIIEGNIQLHIERIAGNLKDGTIIASLTGWKQIAFLPILVVFLLRCYIHISQKNTLENKRALLKILCTELWLAANAYRIEAEYVHIKAIKDPVAQGEALSIFSQTLSDSTLELLNDIKSKDSKFLAGPILCIPIGFPGHAMYLNVIWFRDCFYFRCDNRLKSTGEYHDVKKEGDPIPGRTLTTLHQDAMKSQEVKAYLKTLAEIKVEEVPSDVEKSSSEWNKAQGIKLLKLYSNEPYNFKLPEARTDLKWNPFPAQKEDTCVVENYRTGMMYRLEGCTYKGEQPLVEWLQEKFLKLTITKKLEIKDNANLELMNFQQGWWGYEAKNKNDIIRQWIESKKKDSYYLPPSNLTNFKGRVAEISSLHSLLCYGYDLDIITERERKPQSIYINATADSLNYEFFSREDNVNIKKSTILWHKLPDFPHDTQEIIKFKDRFLPQILALIPELKPAEARSIIEPYVITNISGEGKTEFVTAYIHTEKNYQRYTFHWWIPQNDPEALEKLYKELYPLYLKVLDSYESIQNNEYDPQIFKQMLSIFNDWILVFDGYESAKFPFHLIPTDHFDDNNNRHVLITSSDLSWDYGQTFSLKKWDGVHDYTESCLSKRRVKYSKQDIEIFCNFCSVKLDNHPQTVKFAVNLIDPMVNIKSLVNTWSAQDGPREKYFARFFDELIKKACVFDNVELKTEDFHELLRLLSLLSTSSIDPKFLIEWAKNVGMRDTLLTQLLRSLTNRCIINIIDDNKYSIHSTVQDASFVLLQQLLPQRKEISDSLNSTSKKIMSSLSFSDSQLNKVTIFIQNVHKTIYSGFNYNFEHPYKTYNLWDLVPHIDVFQSKLKELLNNAIGESLEIYNSRQPLCESLIEILLIRLYWLTQLALYFKCQFQSYEKAQNFINEARPLVSVLHSYDEIIKKILKRIHPNEAMYCNLNDFSGLLNHLTFEINQESDPNTIVAQFSIKDKVSEIKRSNPNEWYMSVWSELFMQGLYKKAQKELISIPDINNEKKEPSRTSIKLTLLLAMTDMALGEYSEARELINSSVRKIPKVYSGESQKQWDAHKYLFAKITLDITEGKYSEAEQSINLLQEKITKLEITLDQSNQFEISFNLARLRAKLYLNQGKYNECGAVFTEMNKFNAVSALAQLYLYDKIQFQFEIRDINKAELDLKYLHKIVDDKKLEKHPMNALPFMANGLMHTAKKEFKEATEQFTNALKCRIKSFELYENERHPETLELYLLLTEVHLAQDNIKEAVKYHQLAKNLIVRFRQISNIEYHIFFLKHLNLEIELTLKLKDPLSNLIYTVGYYNSFLKYAKENNISDQHPVMIKSKSLIDSLLSNANFCIFLQQSKQSVSASNDSKFPTSLSAASDTVAFFKRIAISPNTLSTRDEQFKFERHEVAGDGECGYTAFGITRKDVYDLIKSNLIDVQDLLLPVVKEAVLSERFINYLKEKGVANAALLAEYNKYKAAAEQGGNMSNSIIDNLYQKIDLIVIQGYIDYDIRDTKVDAGWSHPRILQVLAYLQKIKLYMWQLSDGKLIPHRQEEYAVYTPPTTVESRIDLLFINNNHFDRLELQSNLAAEMNKDQPFKPDVIMP